MATPKTPMSDPAHMFRVVDAKGSGVQEFTAHPPTPEQLAVMGVEAAAPMDITDGRQIVAKLGALFNYLYDVFENPNDVEIIKRRLRDPKDPLDIEQFMQSFEDFIEEETGFPTSEPSDSAPSPSSTGKRSTGRINPGV